MISFMFGVTVGAFLGLLSLNSYKKSLQMTAKTHHSEYINGQWYRITKEGE